MPTGVALRDPREQLFQAAERVLLREGADALTSRAVTTEAGCAKGVLHRHFADFEDFLAELVSDRIVRLDLLDAGLRARAGTATVTALVSEALRELFGPLTVAMVGLVTSRDGLRARLRLVTPVGIPLLTEATSVISAYLAAERDLGRLAPGSEPDVLAPTLVGTAHLLLADRSGDPPPPATLDRAVATVLAPALTAAR